MRLDNLGTLTNEELKEMFRVIIEERDRRVNNLEMDLINTLKELEGLGIEVANDYGNVFHFDEINFENNF